MDGKIGLEAMIGQLFMLGFRGLSVRANDRIVQDIAERNLGGVVLFAYDVPSGQYVRNIESPRQLEHLTRSLQSYAGTPLLIAVDQEGGRVARLDERFGFSQTRSHRELGAIDDADATYEHASRMARTLKAVGINQNLAPVVDVDADPHGPAIGAHGRCFSADPVKVVQHARAFVRAHRDEGVITTLKHFPGHGSAAGDTHEGFVDVSGTWSASELEPYVQLIADDLADSIMTAHVFNRAWDGSDPATLSRAVLTGLLRDKMEYAGVVISDDLQMGAIRRHYTFDEAIRKSLEAGVDVIAIANNSVYEEDVLARGVETIMSLVDEGAITVERLTASYRRLQNLKSRFL